MIMLTLIYFLCNFPRLALSAVLIEIENEWQVSNQQLLTLFSYQALCGVFAMLSTGYLLSRLKPRQMVCLAAVLTGTGMAILPFLSGFTQVQIVFMGIGAATGLYFTAGMATLVSITRSDDWGKAVGIHELAPNLCFMLSPLLIEVALNVTDWRGAFAASGCIFILAGLLFFFFGKGGYEYAERQSAAGWTKLLGNKTLWILTIIMTVGLVGEFTIYNVLQLYLVKDLGFSSDSANYILSSSRFITPVAVVLGGWAADRFNPRTIIVICMAIYALSLGMMSMSFSPVLAMCGVYLQPVPIAFFFPSVFKVVSEYFATTIQPIVFAIMIPVTLLVNGSIAPTLLGWMADIWNFAASFGAVCAVSAASILLMLLLPKADTAPKTDSAVHEPS